MSKRKGSNQPNMPDNFAAPRPKLRRRNNNQAVPGAAEMRAQFARQNEPSNAGPGPSCASQELTVPSLMEFETYYRNEDNLSTTSSDWSMEVGAGSAGPDELNNAGDANMRDAKSSSSTDVHHPLK